MFPLIYSCYPEKEREESEMTYEIVTLQEKKAVGVSARTSNSAPDMIEVIGGLWQKLFYGGVYPAIEHKANEKALGIYTDYASGAEGDYTAAAVCEVEKAENLPEGTDVFTIPAGRYAKFVVKGDMHQAVADFWSEFQKMDLPRSYVCDFEEYQDDNMEETEIHIYIGLRD